MRTKFASGARLDPLPMGRSAGDVAYLLEGLEPRLMLTAATIDQLSAPWLPPTKFLGNESGYLSKASGKSALSIALQYLQSHTADLGLMAADVANPIVTDQYTDPGTGLTHIYLRQRVNNLPVDNANLNVNIARDGRVLSVGGGFIGGASTSPRGARAVARAAAVTAAGAVDSAFNLTPGSRKAGTIIEKLRGRDTDTFSARDLSLDSINPGMHYLAEPSGLKLAWNLAVRTPDGENWYELNVDAATGAGLARTDWTSHATYNVYALPSESPDDGGRTLLTNPADLGPSPFGWHDTNGIAGAEFTDTRGNNVSAQDDIDANNSGGVRPDGGTGLNFDFPLVLTGAPSTYRPAATTNLFYLNNALHDIHSRYGFTESAGNFQVTNYTGQGAGNDAVQADAQDGSGTNNANFATPPDGTAPRMQMYLFSYTSTGRDGDIDNQIVIHEYGHGVSNRLTGGPANSNALNATQSGGMGEGWSDWWGLMLTQKATDLKNARYPVGTYVLGQNPVTGAGIRRYPYSFDMTVDPLTIASYNSDSSKEVHNTGEIWSTVLWDMNWLLIDKHGFSPTVAAGYDANIAGMNGGNNLALQLVMDALKIQPANPSFLQARDAILQADLVRTGGANRMQIWTAFARRGMGYSFVNASSSGTSVTPATDLPPELLKPRVMTSLPATPQTAPITAVDFNFSKAMNPASFTLADDVVSFTGPGSVDLKSQITGFAWSNSNTTLRVSFSAQSANGQYSMVIGPNVLSADDGSAMDQDADGIVGEASDAYTANFGFDALVLAVTATSPANGATIASPVTSLDLSFNEAVNPASVGINDLTLSQGTVTAAVALNATTVRYTLSGVNSEGALTFTLAAGSVTDASGFQNLAYSGNLVIDIGTRALPTPTPVAPAGSLIYRTASSGAIGAPADVDDFTLSLQAGQVVTVSLAPGTSLRAVIALKDPSGATIGSAAAATSGQKVLLHAITAASTGLYAFSVSSAGGTTGGYAIDVVINADLSNEDQGAGTDDTLATAQLINSGIALPGGSTIASVLGQLPSNAGLALYSEGFESGTLGAAWATYSSAASGQILVSAAQTPQAGLYSLFMDSGSSTGATYILNEAVWTVNLAGVTSPTLTFAARSYSDDTDVLPATFANHYNGDGVAISADGINWYTVWTNVYPSTWTNVSLDLAAAAQSAGFPLGANFKIKFQQYDNYTMTTDGFGWDSLAIMVPAAAQDYYAVTAPAGQWLSITTTRTAGSGVPAVSLYNAAGALLASGATGASGARSVMDPYLVPASGTYYVRVAGSAADYSLVMVRDASLESEPNDTATTAQDITFTRAAVGSIATGALGSVASEDFESGVLGASWNTYSSAPEGKLQVTSTSGAAGGTKALIMAASTTGVYNLNEAIWTVDLSGLTAATLSFSDTVFADEDEPLPALFTGHYNGDGVSISGDDGTSWYTISSAPNGTSGVWVARTIDLATAAAAAGWGLAANFKIKFQQYDNFEINTDGRGYDSISISSPLATDDYYSLQVTAGQSLHLTTATPGDGPGGLSNLLDPKIDLYDAAGALIASDDNSAADGHNARIDLVAITSGLYKIRVRAANDSRGEYVLDAHQYTQAGGVTEAPDLLDSSDTGVSSTDNVTRLDNSAPGKSLQFMIGSTIPGAAVTLYVDGVARGSAVASGYNTMVALNEGFTLTDGPHVVVARQTPVGDLESADSAPLTLTIMTAAPTAPTAPLLRAASDSGLANSDGITNVTTPQFDIAPGNAGYLRLYRDGVVVGSGYLPAGAILTAPQLVDGTSTYTVTAIDAAGNESAASPASAPLTIDTLPPAAPSGALDLQAGSDSGVATTDNITNIAAPVFDLPASAATYFRVYRAAALVSSSFAAGTSFTAPTQADGTAAWTVAFVDIAGNESASSASLTLNIDTVAPAMPPAPDLQASSDGGGSSTDNFTNDTTPTFDVVGAPYFRFYQNAVLISGAYLTGTTYTTAALANGTYSFSLVSLDAAGNASTASPALAVIIDAGILSAPQLDAGSDTGVSSSDRITNLNNATLITALNFVVPGTTAGALVTLYSDGIAIGSAISTGGTITVPSDGSTVIPDGVHTITVRQTPAGGPQSPDSGPIVVTINTVGPAQPTAPDMTDADDTGLSSTDNITSIKTPGFSVPGAAYYRLILNGGQISSDYQTGTLVLPSRSDGTYSVTAYEVDAAGNQSPLSAAASYTIDSIAPLLPAGGPDLQDASDSGFSNTDNLTRITTPIFDISGVPAAHYFRVYRGGTLISSNYQSGSTYLASTQSTGTFVYTFAIIDAAGNLSAQGAGVSVTYDTTAPSSPAAMDLLATSDTGLSSTDNITRDANPVFAVTNVAGNYFRVYRGGVLVSGNYETSATFTTPTADGTYSFTNRSVDSAGNESSNSSSLSITVDTVTPAAIPAPDLSTVSDTGISSADNITSNKTPSFTVSGTTYYRLLVDGTQVSADYQTGSYVLPSGTDGSYSAAAYALDVAGNVSPLSPATAFIIDSVAPQAPVGPADLQDLSDSGFSAVDNLTNAASTTFSLSDIPADAYFRFYRAATLLSSSYQTGATYTTSNPSAGTFAFTYAIVDAAGNASPQSPALPVTFDFTAPTGTPTIDLDAASDTGVSQTDNVTSDTTPTFNVNNPVDGYFQIYRVAALISHKFETGTTYTPVAVAVDGDKTYYSRFIDAAGNLSALSAGLTVTTLTTAPPAPGKADLRPDSDTGASATDDITNAPSVVFDIPTTPGAAIEYFVDGVSMGVAATNAATSGTFPVIVGAASFASVNSSTTRRAELAVTADFNRDGKADVATAGGISFLNMLLGAGNGSFAPMTSINLSAAATSLRTADFNHDGSPDLVVGNAATNAAWVLIGRGDGTFQSAITLSLGATPSDLVVADFNQDTHPDVMVILAASGARFFRGNGDGTFAGAVATASTPAGVLAAADLTGDGRPELIVAREIGPLMYVLPVNLDGTVGTASSRLLQYTPRGIDVADVNADGRPDVLLATTGGATVLLRTATGGFTSQELLATSGFHSIRAADFNADGKLDLALAYDYGGTIQVRLGNGDGTFKRELSVQASAYVSALIVPDLTGDGRADLVSLDSTYTTLNVLTALPGFPLTDGVHTIATRLTNLVGLTSEMGEPLEFTVDTVAPSSTYVPITTADQTPELTGTVNDPNATATVSWALRASIGIYNTTMGPGGVWILPDNAIPSPLDFATYTIAVVSTDAAGNVHTDTFPAGLKIDLTAPIGVAEPAFTTGTSNTITWAPVTGADSYQIQVDTDSSFATPDAESSGIVGTTYTFTGLTGGTRYYYRVRALKQLTDGAFVTQNSQEKYEAGATISSGLSTSWSPGRILLNHSPTTMFADDFEDGDYAGWTVGAGAYTREVTTTTAASGTSSLSLTGGFNTFRDGLSKPISGGSLASGIPDRLRFRIRAADNNKYQGYTTFSAGGGYYPMYFSMMAGGVMGLTVGDVPYTTPYAANRWYDVVIVIAYQKITFSVDGVVVRSDIPYTNISGAAVTALELANYSPGSQVWWDGIEVSKKNTLATVGSIVSAPIAPPQADFRRWGAVVYSAIEDTYTPFTIDVLDIDGNVLAADIPSGANLFRLGITAPSIRLRANFTSNAIGGTPILERWTVGYTVGDGDAVSTWSPTVFSTQDVIVPVLGFQSSPTNSPSPALTGTIDDGSATVRVTIDGHAFDASNPGDGTWILAAGAISPGLSDGVHTVLVTATDPAGNVATISSTLAVVLAAPALANWQINDGHRQRTNVSSLSLVFTTSVSLASGVVTLTRRDGTPIAVQVANPSGDGKRYVVTFMPDGATLSDGFYDLVVHHALIKDGLNRSPTGADAILSFHRLEADFDGDAAVGLNDLIILANQYGVSVGSVQPWTEGDSDGDGAVNLNDLIRLANNYGRSIVPMAAAALEVEEAVAEDEPAPVQAPAPAPSAVPVEEAIVLPVEAPREMPAAVEAIPPVRTETDAEVASEVAPDGVDVPAVVETAAGVAVREIVPPALVNWPEQASLSEQMLSTEPPVEVNAVLAETVAPSSDLGPRPAVNAHLNAPLSAPTLPLRAPSALTDAEPSEPARRIVAPFAAVVPPRPRAPLSGGRSLLADEAEDEDVAKRGTTLVTTQRVVKSTPFGIRRVGRVRA